MVTGSVTAVFTDVAIYEAVSRDSLHAVAQLLNAEVHALRENRERALYHLSDIDGCLAEYEDMPCKSLQARLRAAVDRAKKDI